MATDILNLNFAGKILGIDVWQRKNFLEEASKCLSKIEHICSKTLSVETLQAAFLIGQHPKGSIKIANQDHIFKYRRRTVELGSQLRGVACQVLQSYSNDSIEHLKLDEFLTKWLQFESQINQDICDAKVQFGLKR